MPAGMLFAMGGADGGGGGGGGAAGLVGSGVAVDFAGAGAADCGLDGGSMFPKSAWAILLRVSRDESSSSSLLSSSSFSWTSSQSDPSSAGAVLYEVLTLGGAGLLDGAGGAGGAGATGAGGAGAGGEVA